MDRSIGILRRLLDLAEVLAPTPTRPDYDAAVRATPDEGFDWIGWATPAILTVLDEHRLLHAGRCACGEYSGGYEYWTAHVAPLVAARVGCDPERAARALSRYKPDKV